MRTFQCEPFTQSRLRDLRESDRICEHHDTTCCRNERKSCGNKHKSGSNDSFGGGNKRNSGSNDKKSSGNDSFYGRNGNSDGDLAMLQSTAAGTGARRAPRQHEAGFQTGFSF